MFFQNKNTGFFNCPLLGKWLFATSLKKTLGIPEGAKHQFLPGGHKSIRSTGTKNTRNDPFLDYTKDPGMS